MIKNYFVVIYIFLFATFSFSNEITIFSDSIAVSDFWEIESATLNRNQKNKTVKKVLDYYISGMFNIDSPTQISNLILLTKYSDAGAEYFVDYWIKLIKTRQNLFIKGIKSVDKSLYDFFICYLEIFPQEDGIEITNLIKKNDLKK